MHSSVFQITVNLAFHLETNVPESGKRVKRHRIQVCRQMLGAFTCAWNHLVACCGCVVIIDILTEGVGGCVTRGGLISFGFSLDLFGR